MYLTPDDIEYLDQIAREVASVDQGVELSRTLDEVCFSSAQAHAGAATLRAQYEWDRDTPIIEELKRRQRVTGSGSAEQPTRYAAVELAATDAHIQRAIESDIHPALDGEDALYSAVRAGVAPKYSAPSTPVPKTAKTDPFVNRPANATIAPKTSGSFPSLPQMPKTAGAPPYPRTHPQTVAGDAFVNRSKELPRTAPPSNATDPYPGPRPVTKATEADLYRQLRAQVGG